MAYTSTLAKDHKFEQRLFDYMRAELGTKEINYDRLNLYASREAQRDGKPTLSWDEATAAARAYAEHKPLTRLPGPDRQISFLLEDGATFGGIYYSAARWEEILKSRGELLGVEVELKLIPGTTKKASWWKRLLGETDQGRYTIVLTGPKSQVEHLMDDYHAKLYTDDRTGE